MTCDVCQDKGDEPTIIHSQIEFGEITLREFVKRLKKMGWMRTVDGKDACPGHAIKKTRKEKKS
jgi:hypothetical protein